MTDYQPWTGARLDSLAGKVDLLAEQIGEIAAWASAAQARPVTCGDITRDAAAEQTRRGDPAHPVGDYAVHRTEYDRVVRELEEFKAECYRLQRIAFGAHNDRDRLRAAVIDILGIEEVNDQ